MTTYVDGFLLPIAADKIDAYKKMADKASVVWMDHGALAYWETVGDDLNNEGTASFATAAGAKENELVVLAWVVYPSRADRDRIMAAVMEDPRLQDNGDMPFDMARMAYAGFKPLVSVSKS
jgi:uncharacterized protein YbaA (DUF1428 family)